MIVGQLPAKPNKKYIKQESNHYIIATRNIKNAQPGLPVIKANNASMVPKNALSESMLFPTLNTC